MTCSGCTRRGRGREERGREGERERDGEGGRKELFQFEPGTQRIIVQIIDCTIHKAAANTECRTF